MSKFFRQLLSSKHAVLPKSTTPPIQQLGKKQESIVKSLLMPFPIKELDPVDDPVDSLPNVNVMMFPSEKFKQRIQTANDLWMQEFLRPLQSRIYPRARIHVLGTSLVNLPRLVTLPFSHNKKLVFEGQRALEHFLELYQSTGMDTTTNTNVKSSVAGHSHMNQASFSNTQTVSILCDENPSKGSWLMEDYASILQPFFETESVEKSIGGGLVSVRRPATTAEDRLGQVKIWSRQQSATFESIDTPSDWTFVLQHTGLIPQWDLISFLSSVIDYREEYVQDPILREISPQVVSMDLAGLSEEQLELIADSCFTNSGSAQLHRQLQRWKTNREQQRLLEPNSKENPLDSCTETDSAESMQARIALVYAHAGIQAAEIGMITTGNLFIDGIFQRLVLGPEEMRRYLDILSGCALPSPDSSSQHNVGITRRLAQTMATADRLEQAIDQHIASLDDTDTTVVIVADRSVASILHSNLAAA
ncbi:hypothetical protein MT418_004144 [Batrachochytrium dendrobatidis]